MRYLTAFMLASLLCTGGIGYAQKRLAIVGSSTSACTGPSTTENCYVGRLRTYFNTQAPNDTTIDNGFAQPGNNCYSGMPSWYKPPYTWANLQPDPDHNITAALASNPDVILVNYPTNAYDSLRVDSVLFCLRSIRETAAKAGIPCFVTTTQPRGQFSTEARARLKELRDSIILEMGYFAINFWDGIANPADNSILAAYDAGDGIHLNDAGHEILFQRILAKNIFLTGAGGALPAKFIQFNTVNKNNSNIVNWTTAGESGVAFYEIQRSADGNNFSVIGKVNANNTAGNNQYQYSDDQPAKGWNYYKIIIVDRDGRKQASPVMSVRGNTGKTGIIKTFANTAQVVVELQSNAAQNIQLQVLNNMGVLISRESRKIEAGNTTLYLNTPSLSSGVYHVRLTTAGETMLSSFIKQP